MIKTNSLAAVVEKRDRMDEKLKERPPDSVSATQSITGVEETLTAPLLCEYEVVETANGMQFLPSLPTASTRSGNDITLHIITSAYAFLVVRCMSKEDCQ